MTIKEKLHRLVDELPKRELPAARRFLEYLRAAGSDPLIEAMRRAPEDDEPLSAADAAAITAAERALARGQTRSHAAVRRRSRR